MWIEELEEEEDIYGRRSALMCCMNPNRGFAGLHGSLEIPQIQCAPIVDAFRERLSLSLLMVAGRWTFPGLCDGAR